MITTIFQMAKLDGSYQAARTLLNYYVTRKIGMGLNELPDRSEFVDLIEEMSDIINDVLTGDVTQPEAIEYLTEIMSDIDIEHICMS